MAVKRIGVISDTHGLLRDEVKRALSGSDLIIHAGDVGKPEILADLKQIAPLIAVRGNIDRADWARELPARETVEFDGLKVFVIHDLTRVDIDPTDSGVDLVVYGHSHKPAQATKGGVFYLNPGSAGPRRFSLPVSMAWIRKNEKLLETELLEL